MYLLLTHIKETVEDASTSRMSSLFLGQVAGGVRWSSWAAIELGYLDGQYQECMDAGGITKTNNKIEFRFLDLR
jgi:hypothetical protein